MLKIGTFNNLEQDYIAIGQAYVFSKTKAFCSLGQNFLSLKSKCKISLNKGHILFLLYEGTLNVNLVLHC